MKIIVGLDVGGTNCRIVIWLNGKIGRRVTIPTNTESYEAFLLSITRAINELCEGYDVAAIGMAIAGAVQDGRVIGSSNLPHLIGKPLASDLGRAFEAPVALLNDCAAAGLGEYTSLGKPLIYLIIGTGVGVSIVLDEQTVIPTELGHMTITRSADAPCCNEGCGGKGHLEALVSGSGIKRRFNMGAERLTERQWHRVLQDMAIGISNLSLIGPGFPIVLGGGVALGRLRMESFIQLEQMARELPTTAPSLEIMLAVHEDNSGIVGAFTAARQLVAI